MSVDSDRSQGSNRKQQYRVMYGRMRGQQRIHRRQFHSLLRAEGRPEDALQDSLHERAIESVREFSEDAAEYQYHGLKLETWSLEHPPQAQFKGSLNLHELEDMIKQLKINRNPEDELLKATISLQQVWRDCELISTQITRITDEVENTGEVIPRNNRLSYYPQHYGLRPPKPERITADDPRCTPPMRRIMALLGISDWNQPVYNHLDAIQQSFRLNADLLKLSGESADVDEDANGYIDFYLIHYGGNNHGQGLEMKGYLEDTCSTVLEENVKNWIRVCEQDLVATLQAEYDYQSSIEERAKNMEMLVIDENGQEVIESDIEPHELRRFRHKERQTLRILEQNRRKNAEATHVPNLPNPTITSPGASA